MSATFFLSDSFRKDTTFFVADRNEEQIIQLEGRHIKGLNPDERAIAGWLRKNLRSESMGFRVLPIKLDEFFREFKDIFILDRDGIPFDDLCSLHPGALFVVGSHRGYSTKDKELLRVHDGKLISLGRQEYLSSTILSIIQWKLDDLS